MENEYKTEEQLSELADILQYNAQSEHPSQAGFEYTGISTVILKNDNTILLTNGEFEELTGYNSKEVEGKKKWTEVIYRKDNLEWIEEYNHPRDVNPLSAPGIYEFRFVNRREQVKDIVATLAAIPGTNQTLMTLLDITNHRQARKSLQKAHNELEIKVRERTAELEQANKALQMEISMRKLAEEKILILANLSDISPLSIVVHDLQGNFLYANQKTFDMHGYSKEEFLARKLHEIDAPSSNALIEERIKEIIRTGEAQFDVEHYRKDGTCFPLEVFVKATKWKNQIVLLSVASDVTERRRIEEELRKYREKLEIMVEERTSELEEKTRNLQEVNTALNVLLQKRKEDKKLLEDRFISNIGNLVMPYVDKIRKNNLDLQQKFCVDIIEKNLAEITSPLLNNIRQFNLTPREMQIASMIKDGKTTKEIAKALGIVEGSIDTHRKNIRKKMGMNRASNLQSHLRFLENR